MLEWLPLENKLVLHTNRLDDDMLTTVDELLERVLPQNIEVVRHNHDISISWQEIPEGFTVVEWLGTETYGRYIDADIRNTYDIEIWCRFSLLEDALTQDRKLFGGGRVACTVGEVISAGK